MMTKVQYPDAVLEASKLFRVHVLGKLIGLQAGTTSDKLIPLAAIMDAGVSNHELREVLRGLYRAGLIRAGNGAYRVMPKGRHIYRVLRAEHELTPNVGDERGQAAAV
jgi:hypothetical protein